MEDWKILCRDTEQDIITANEKRLDDYNKSQAEAIKQLHNLADDAGGLENELRKLMENAVTKVKGEFAQYEKDSSASMDNASTAFNTQAQKLRDELEEMNKELDKIRKQAYDNASEKLNEFEKEFTAELGKRASESGIQIADWQAGLEKRLENSNDKIANDWKASEEKITSDHKKNISALSERLFSDLERIKQEAALFEESIRKDMHHVEEDRAAFTEQNKIDLQAIRLSSENEVKAQVGQYQILMQDTLRQKQREIEKELDEINELSKSTFAELEKTSMDSKQTMDDWQSQYNTRMREMDTSLEEIKRRSREAEAENEERIAQFRQSVEEIHKELGVQKKKIDQTGVLKKDLEKSMEEINGELDRLEQRRTEIAALEAKLTNVRKHEDEINNKMTRFLTEQRRIEQMEKDFNNLIKSSQSVKEKLEQVSSSDDILQAVQVQIRNLEAGIKDTEAKYQRIEKKNEVLDQTNEGIDRNFKALQKTETSIKNAEKVIEGISTQFEKLRSSIDLLASQNEKANDAVAKITSLDESLVQIENRIADMNKYRESVARLETDLIALDRDAKAYIKLAKDHYDQKSGKIKAADKGTATPLDRETVLRLKSQGWSIDEIANSLERGRGEIELILEIASRS